MKAYRLTFSSFLCLSPARLQHIFFYAHKKTVKNPMNTNPENDEEADRREGWWEEEQARLIAENKRPPIDPRYSVVSPLGTLLVTNNI